MDYTLKQLESASGKLWEKNDMRRVYFNSLADRIGLSVTRYNTGNISSASIEGEGGISNCRARKILSSLEYGKIYYDLNDNQFHTKNLGEYEDKILNSIKTDVQNVVDAETTPVKTVNNSDTDIDNHKKDMIKTDVIEYTVGYGSMGICWEKCGDRLNDFLLKAAMYTKQSVADVMAALTAGKRVMTDYENDIGAYYLRNATIEKPMEKRIADENRVRAELSRQKYAKTHKRYRCKSCGTSGYRGSHPFSTAPDTGYCDDCL